MLRSLRIEGIDQPPINKTLPYTVQLKLESRIEASELSLEPFQINHWIQQYLNQPLKIVDIKRNELQLFQC